MDRSSCSRSHGHSTRSRRVSSSRDRTASAPRCGSAATRLLAGRRGRRRGAGGRRGRRRGLRGVLAVLGLVALLAVRLALPLLLEALDERVQRLLLLLGGEQLLDGGGGLLERLLRGRRHLVDLEDVVAELRLDGPDELALLGVEDGGVERLLLL